MDPEIKMSTKTYIDTMFFTHDQVIIHNNEFELQRSMFQFQQVCSNYNIKLSVQKTETVAFMSLSLIHI